MNRADFVTRSTALGVGLSLGFVLPAKGQTLVSSQSEFVPNAWVRIAPDDTVTVVLSKSEMGQGVIMGLPTILADELDASIARVRTEFAPPDPRYIDPALGTMATGGSTSVNSGWLPLRKAGATARAMLLAAAAQQWGVPKTECTTRAGVVYHEASKRNVTYGSLVALASAQEIPTDVTLKSTSQFEFIGKTRSRTDIPSKVNGSAQYGIDVRLPGMVYAAIARSPVFGGRVKHYDATKAHAVPGVLRVVQISNGVAVVAKNTWAAFQGKNALAITWDEGANANVSTASLFAEAERLALTRKNERVALHRGKPEMAKGQVLEATYRGPFLAHATMEPMNTTAHVHDGRCEVWTPTQVQMRAQLFAAKGSGLPPEKCTINTTLLGGGFGRRLEADYVQEAAEVAKAVGVPVKVTWTREDDVQGDFYRPMSLNVVRGVLSGGKVTSLSHLVVSPSWLRHWYPPAVANGIDPLDLLEVTDAPYTIPNVRVSYIDHEHGIPVGSWRAPDANWNGFVTESFIDELSYAAGVDPLKFRLSMLRKNPRAAHVLELAARNAGYGEEHPGIEQGVAVTFWAGSYVGMVADVSVTSGVATVHRITAAVDCGTVVNPDIVVQQCESATIFGLSTLLGKITIANGRVEQNNFYDYQVPRLKDAPAIDTFVVSSNATPTGIGEVCTPPAAPAVANALYRLTSKRLRTLPIGSQLSS